MENKKKTYFCELCKNIEIVNRGKNHHIIPRRLNTKSKLKVWLCKGCHIIIHNAEMKGLCKLPKSNEEYKKWKEEAKVLSSQ